MGANEKHDAAYHGTDQPTPAPLTIYPMSSSMRAGKTRYAVRDPQCPDGPHPTRWCKCQTFNTRTQAEKYAQDQENPDD